MHPAYSPSAGVVHPGESLVPGQCLGRAARHTGHAGHTPCGTVAGEVGGKERAVVIFLLVAQRIDGEAFGGVRQ